MVLRPYLKMQPGKLTKVAGLVLHVPHEVDVTAHIAAMGPLDACQRPEGRGMAGNPRMCE